MQGCTVDNVVWRQWKLPRMKHLSRLSPLNCSTGQAWIGWSFWAAYKSSRALESTFQLAVSVYASLFFFFFPSFFFRTKLVPRRMPRVHVHYTTHAIEICCLICCGWDPGLDRDSGCLFDTRGIGIKCCKMWNEDKFFFFLIRFKFCLILFELILLRREIKFLRML